MKRNLLLRLGLLALVLTLITMPLVSGTYAKYVTTAQGSAQARVAKWGVDIIVDADNMFGQQYYDAKEGQNYAPNTVVETNDDQNTANISVIANGGNKVLAPGTQGHMLFAIFGQPEVAFRFEVDSSFVFDEGWKVFEKEYEPINFAFGIQMENENTGEIKYLYLDAVPRDTELGDMNGYSLLEPVYFNKEQIEDILNDAKYNMYPNTNLLSLDKNAFPNSPLLDEGGELADYEQTNYFILEWIWPYEVEDDGNGNLKDGYIRWEGMEEKVRERLGSDASLADIYNFADTSLGDSEDDLELEIIINITVTQID
ncbi:MAG: hypothetical protein GX138_02610 [Firmicutes bacterium]|jgi:hypothetical protein|nr:hypothetical protein [Bacillota bacterium]